MSEKDLGDLAEMFRRLPDQLEESVSFAVRKAADEAADRARLVHGYTDRSGALTNSVDSDGPTGSVSGNDLQATVSAGAAHASYIEKGTPPHKIRPRFRKMLRFPVEGGFVFAREVNHPGTKAIPFLSDAVAFVEPRLEDELLPQAVELAFAKAGFV